MIARVLGARFFVVRDRLAPTIAKEMKALAILLLLGGLATAGPRRRVVVDTHIEILDPIRFVGTTPTIAASSTRMLDAMAETLNGNPSLRLLEIRAFGNDAPVDQLVLGERRARAIVSALVRRGVAPGRLRAAGAARPDHGNDPGPQVLILQRAP